MDRIYGREEEQDLPSYRAEVSNKVATQVLQMVKALSPIRTGNLRHNGIWLEPLGDGRFEILIGGEDESRAPYAVYTNEPWTSDRWGGKKNPNEGWINDAIELCVTFLASNNNGRVEKK